MKLVLDTSAFLSGRLNNLNGIEAYTTPDICDEVALGRPSVAIQRALDAGLVVRSPLTLEKAKDAARSTGDLDRLSRADLSVIALGMELAANVVTDDFRVQNVLRSVDIGIIPAGEIGQRTISDIWTWRYRCRGCGRFYDRDLPDCPVCGSALRAVRSKERG